MITVPERLQDDLEVLRKMFDGFSSSLRVAAPGIIQSFNAAKQTVKVKIAIREKITNPKTRIVEDVEISELVDVLVFMPRAGGFSLTLPITAGDECFVIFADNCFDAWYQSGGIQNQTDRRRHDLSDGIAICGIWSQPKAIPAYSTNSAQLRNAAGSVMVEVKDDVVNIGGSTFRKLIDERLLDAFNNHTHPTAGTGAPSTPTTPLVLANIATIKTKAG